MSCSEYTLLKNSITKTKHPSYNNVIAFCKFVRDNKIRESNDLVAKHGFDILQRYSLGSEALVFAEQVCIASLDMNDISKATFCISYLEKNVGQETNRIKRLKGMLKEAEGDFLGATVLYQQILMKDPTDIQTLKRQICVSKSQGDRENTIKLMNQFLTVFMSDFETWLELAELYVSCLMYQNAAFCYEELILLQPQNYHLYVKYGEILYTIGGIENLILARKHFSFALELSKTNNQRAFWGLALVSHAISHSKNITQKDMKMSQALFQLSSEQILSKCEKESNLMKISASVLQELEPAKTNENNTVTTTNTNTAASSSKDARNKKK